MRTSLLAPLLLIAPSMLAQPLELRFDRLTTALAALNAGDRRAVDEAIELIKRGENNLALARLTPLNSASPANSSLRILTAYATLQLGNLLGAFEEAKKAEKAADHTAYACWFLAKLSLLKGDQSACKREIKHLKGVPEMSAEVRQLESDLNTKKN